MPTARFGIAILALAFVALTVGCQATDVLKISEFPEQQRPIGQTLSVVAWNAQKGNSERFRPDLARLIIVDRPDIVFLQEATADLLTTKRIGGYFASSWSYPWPNGKTIGLLTLSYVPPTRIQPLPSRHKEFFVTAPKLSLATVEGKLPPDPAEILDRGRLATNSAQLEVALPEQMRRLYDQLGNEQDRPTLAMFFDPAQVCLLYTSDAADE